MLRSAIRVLAAATALMLSLGWPPGEASAACGDFGPLGVAVGAGLGGGALVTSAFAAPGLALLGRSDLTYWEGVGWTSLGAATGLAVSLAATAPSCAYPESMWVPPTATVVGGALAAVLWATLSPSPEPSTRNLDRTSPRRVTVSVSLAPTNGGAFGALVGTF